MIVGVVGLLLLAPAGAGPSSTQNPDLRIFFDAASSDEKRAKAALGALTSSWRDGFAAPLIDIAGFLRGPGPITRAAGGDPAASPRAAGDGLGRDPESDGAPFGGPETSRATAFDGPGSVIRRRLTSFLEARTGKRFGHDLRAWRRWLWSLPYDPHPEYPVFKAALYGRIDSRMAAFFTPAGSASIRLDEVDWGGVGVNGIPPLDHPRHVPGAEAGWLKGAHVVFGVVVNGEARAYPKRILAWHELARDRLGGVELAVVYCTLCGTVVPYRSEAGGRTLTFGTSGLLYRSNKLMFDEETHTLWNASTGRPVIGPLVGTGLELRAEPVVTTTWREWRTAHPDTSVLDRETGHRRDYSEGAAYREYFATDRLMFEVPRMDGRLKNKAEVLGVLLPSPGPEGAPRRALALSVEFLRRNPVHHLVLAGRALVVVTSVGGANRVYATDGRRLTSSPEGTLRDESGGRWMVTEEALRPASSPDRPFPRVPARRAFWFGWQAQFPDTELVR